MGKIILIVEDDVRYGETLKEILRLFNYDAIVAHEGKVGITMAISEKPDLILCDLHLPKTTGIYIYQKLKKHFANSMPPFVFITADSTSARTNVLEFSTCEFLLKPFSVEKLLKVIEERLNNE